MNPKFFTLATYAILIQFTFYVTSHQPTLSQIDWKAAFVGRTYYQDNSNLISGVLVLSNIFCGVILFGLMFPMLIIAPFLVHVKYPEFRDIFRKSVKKTQEKAKPSGKSKEETSDYKIESLSQNDEDAVETVAEFDVTRGELNLYENERCLLVSGFRVASKLLLLQGFRVSLFTPHCHRECQNNLCLSVQLDFLLDAGLYHTLSPSDGMEDLCTAVHLRRNRNVHLCSGAVGGIPGPVQGAQGSCGIDREPNEATR